MFSGSYLKDDVEYLLKVIEIESISVEEKEKNIQNGAQHYSQMISKEYEPTQGYLDIFYKAHEYNKKRFARDIVTLAHHLSQKKDIVLVSLARAGTPIGVLIKRTLKERYNRECKHYSISIIRDREIDKIALTHITKNYPKSELIFIDGWTGKGVINRELKAFIHDYNKEHASTISDNLYVISDIAGVADFAVTNEDYLIPSSALNSTISGLVSRSILNDTYIKEGDFHGCKYYSEYAESDLSLWFIDEVMKLALKYSGKIEPLIKKNNNININVNIFLQSIQKKYLIENINYIKPGIGESTRVLLRRVPFIIFLKDINMKDVEHILVLAKEKNVHIIEDNTIPYTALAIIKDISS